MPYGGAVGLLQRPRILVPLVPFDPCCEEIRESVESGGTGREGPGSGQDRVPYGTRGIPEALPVP